MSNASTTATEETFLTQPLSNDLDLQQKPHVSETENQELNEAEEAMFRLAAIVESSDDAIVSKDLNGIVTSWNHSAERMFGFTPQEIVGKSITILIPPELQSDENRILAKLRAGERIDHFQTVRLTKSGERIDVSLTISPVIGRHGKIVGAAKIVRDITRQKKLEAALHTTERLASVGRLAATIAHEINNPLESVINFVYLARQQPDISEETKSYLVAADRELGRVAHIARQTLGFYRDNSRPTEVRIGALIDEVVTVYESKMRVRSLRLERRIQPDAAVVALYGEVKQIVSNLLVNAIDASKIGGRIVIACRNSLDLAGNCGLRITIADDGQGISAEDQAKIFAPFFTTKQAIGTGLGLWITREMMEKRGGRITFRSSTNPAHSGTVMALYFPSASGPSGLPDAPSLAECSTHP